MCERPVRQGWLRRALGVMGDEAVSEGVRPGAAAGATAGLRAGLLSLDPLLTLKLL